MTDPRKLDLLDILKLLQLSLYQLLIVSTVHLFGAIFFFLYYHGCRAHGKIKFTFYFFYFSQSVLIVFIICKHFE